MFKKIASFFLVLVVFSFLTFSVSADGTVSGTILGPHGETAAVGYTFTKTGSTVSGTTASDGTFSQSVADGDWVFTVTPPSSFQYADTFSIPKIRVGTGDSFNLGTISFHYQVPAGTDSDLEEFSATPPTCSLAAGTPVIFRAYYEDQQKGSFLYVGRTANIIVVADRDDYTVEVDYSYIEGDYTATLFSNANTETAVSQGNGKYKATHTVTLATMGGGMPLIKVTSTASSSTYKCLDGGPVNLDIRTFFSGSGTTDFSSVTDFRSITNFTMHQTGVVKVAFSQAVNMLDPTVQRFMKSIGSKMVGANGSLNLDAKAVLELKNAGAVITMYGINLNSPKIQIDGVDDSSGVTSSLTYDKSTQTLVFNAAHFTTFTAVESSSSGSSSTSSPTTPTCDKQAPDHSPDLFQIDTTKNTAKLFFTPVNNAVDYYYIAYGFTEGDERFGVKFDKGYYDGVIDYTINELAPNTNYYFKVRAGNGCATGSWSNWMLAKTDGGFVQTIVNDSTSLKTSSSIKEPTVEPTKTIKTPTLGVSDYVSPSQPVSQPTTKKSWWQKFIEYFKSTKP